MLSGRGQGVPPCYVQVGVEVHIFYSASMTPKVGRVSELPLGGGGSSGFPLSILYTTLAGRGRSTSLLCPMWLLLTPWGLASLSHGRRMKVPAPHSASSDTTLVGIWQRGKSAPHSAFAEAGRSGASVCSVLYVWCRAVVLLPFSGRLFLRTFFFASIGVSEFLQHPGTQFRMYETKTKKSKTKTHTQVGSPVCHFSGPKVPSYPASSLHLPESSSCV